MMNDFYTNLTTITNNLEDIAFTKYATITNLNGDGTCTAKEDEEEGLTHENINTLGNNLRVGDKVVLGFVDNSIYNPVILTGGEEAYTKTEADALLQKKINEPINEGTNGQVLTTDGEGGRTWKTVQGGGTGVDIATSWGNPTSDSKVPSEKLAKDTLDGKANVSHTHTKSEITDFPSIPSSSSDLSDGSNIVKKSSTSGLLKSDGTVDTTSYLSSLPSHTHDDRYYTESEVNTALNGKQDTLVSGTSIKTINNTSLLGSGNITVGGGGNVPTKTSDLTNDGDDGVNPFVSDDDSRLSDARTPTTHTHTSNQVTDLINTIYPVGSIYMSVNSTSPSTLFGGTWEKIKDTFLLASGDVYSNGATGGEATHTLTTDEMPSHNHNYYHYQANGSITRYSTSWANQKSTTVTTEGTGGGQPHNNMPPYLAVNVWKRTA